MSLPIRISILSVAILAGLLMVWGVVWAAPKAQASPGSVPSAQASPDSGPGAQAKPDTQMVFPTPMPLPNQPDRPVRPAGSVPDIGFIDSPSAVCQLPKPHTGVCYMTWNYLYVNGSPNYMITMTVNIDGKFRAIYTGFFQTYMYVPSELMVFQVPCGTAGSGIDPLFGLSHSYTLRARDSSGLVAANYGSATCPADDLYHVYLAVVRR